MIDQRAGRTLVGFALLAMAGCAAKPQDIQATNVSAAPYQGHSCQQLTADSQRVSTELADASAKQTHARRKDTLGVAIVGVPLASVKGQDIAPEIGRLKGEQDAIYKTAVAKGCNPPKPS